MSAGQGSPLAVAAAAGVVEELRHPLQDLRGQADAFVRAAKSPATLRAYRADWDHFTGWCSGHGLSALPATPETVALYLTALAAPHRPATMTRRLTSINKAHQIAGEPSPGTMQQAAVSETLKGIRRRSAPHRVPKLRC